MKIIAFTALALVAFCSASLWIAAEREVATQHKELIQVYTQLQTALDNLADADELSNARAALLEEIENPTPRTRKETQAEWRAKQAW